MLTSQFLNNFVCACGCCCCSAFKSCPTVCDPMDGSMSGSSSTISRSLLKFMSVESVMPSNHLILCCPLLLLPSIFPSTRVFSSESALQSGDQSIGASVLPMNIQDWFLLGLTGLISYPRDSEESSPAPQFKSISSLVLSLLYGPTLTFVHDYW